jgi:hypothetical protein
MTMPTDFQTGTNWQQASGPLCIVDVQESDCWPVDDRSGSGTKDTLAAGKHPVVAIGGRTAALGRPLNVTGVVVSFTGTDDSGTATDRVEVNIADGYIVRQWVSNILTYGAGPNYDPATFEQTPVVGQPVYVDDSHDLSEGVTLSMSPLNAGASPLKNPLAGYLWYCQDEIADGVAGGARAAATFDTSLPNAKTEQEYCVLLINGARDLA